MNQVNNRWTKAVILILRLIIGGIFIYAAIGKIIDPSHFAHDVSAYRILPTPLVNVFAIFLPYIELLAGIGLLTGFWLDACSAIISILTVIFLIAAISAMARGLNIECGCFTLSSHGKVGWELITRDILMLAGGVVVLLSKIKQKGT